MSGGHIMPAIMNGLQMVAGAGSEVLAPGNPFGATMMMNGLNGFMGGGGSNSGGTGFAAPGTSGTPNLEALTPQLPSWLQGGTPGVPTPPIVGVSASTGPPNPPGGTNWLSMLGGSNGIANTIGGLASAAGVAGRNMPGPPQQVQSYAPAFSPGGGSIPAFGASPVVGPQMRNPITLPSANAQLLQMLGFQR